MRFSFLSTQLGALKRTELPGQAYRYIHAEQLNLPLAAAAPVKERNPLDWFELTESAHSILHGLVALADRKEMNEWNKPKPDQQRIDELKALGNEAMAMVEQPENFSS